MPSACTVKIESCPRAASTKRSLLQIRLNHKKIGRIQAGRAKVPRPLLRGKKRVFLPKPRKLDNSNVNKKTPGVVKGERSKKKT
jgi:hypothetical protein